MSRSKGRFSLDTRDQANANRRTSHAFTFKVCLSGRGKNALASLEFYRSSTKQTKGERGAGRLQSSTKLCGAQTLPFSQHNKMMGQRLPQKTSFISPQSLRLSEIRERPTPSGFSMNFLVLSQGFSNLAGIRVTFCLEAKRRRGLRVIWEQVGCTKGSQRPGTQKRVVPSPKPLQMFESSPRAAQPNAEQGGG